MAYTADEIKKQMQANSEAWHTADSATKKKLEAENQKLGSQLGASYNSSTGTWSDPSGNKLYNVSGSSGKKNSGSGSSNGYTPLGTHNDETIKTLSGADYAKIQEYKKQYEDAKLIGDTDAMEAAHKAADALREQYGYRGGDDGSDYIGIATEDFDIPTFVYGSSRPTYESKYRDNIDDLLNAILTRDNFSYDVNNDPLYAQYKQEYLREGNRAMNDALASAAAGAGGMNSYAITAGQQAQNYYAAQLGDKIPELYDLAYGMYLDDIDNDVRNLGLLEQMDDTQYNRYRDTMSDWENDRDFAYNKYRDDMSDYFYDRDFNYAVSRDEVEDDRYINEWNYQLSQDRISNSSGSSNKAYNRVMDMLESGIMPDSATLSAAGMTASEAQAYINNQKYGISDLSSNAQTVIRNIEENKNQYLSGTDDIAYAIAKAATPKGDGTRAYISGDEAAILFRYFGYDPALWMDLDED